MKVASKDTTASMTSIKRISASGARLRLLSMSDNRYLYRYWSLMLFASNIYSPFSSAEDQKESLQFNTNIIESVGLSREQVDDVLAQYEKPQGKKDVGIYLNEKYTDVIEVEFGKDGKVCLNHPLLTAFMIKDDLMIMDPNTGCVDTDAAPQIKINYNRTANALHFYLPDYYFDKDSAFKNIKSGGFGTFLNYNVNANHNTSYFSQSDSVNALMAWGANFNNYLLRTSFSYSKFNNSVGNSYSHQNLNSAYLETDWADTYRVRAGYISVGNSLFGAGQINGFTLHNDVGHHSGDTTVNVSGLAPSYSQIEVYQQGRVIFSRPAPAGPFLFEAVPLLTAYSDAEVVMRENSGGEQRFIIPRAAFSVSKEMSSRFSMFAGQTDPSQGLGNTPVFGAEYRLPFYEYVQPFAGMLLASNYVGIGYGIGGNWIPYSTLGRVNISTSRSGRDGDMGSKLSSSLSSQIADTSPYLSFDWQSYRYRDFGQSQQNLLVEYFDESSVPHYTISAGINKPLNDFSTGFSLSRYTYYNMPANNTLSVYGTYAARYYSLSANLSYGWAVGSNGNPDTWGAVVSLRVPFKLAGKSGSLFSYVNNYQHNTLYGNSINQTITDNLDMGIGLEHSTRSYHTRHSVQAFWRTPYSNINGYYAGTNDHNRSYSTNLSGALVTTGKQIVFSPAPIQDTFAIVDTGVQDYVSVQTPTSRLITNRDGLTVAPQLFEGKTNVINIVTKTLPDGAYVKNPRQEIMIKRGAVGEVGFSSEQDRQYLIKLISSKTNFPLGTKVLDEQAVLLGYTIDENILILGKDNLEKLVQTNAYVTTANKLNCYINKQSFDPKQVTELFEVEVICGDKNE